jgi:hypothetical protein
MTQQGRATTSRVGDTKVEPKSHAVNVEYVANCGIQQVTLDPVPMYEGRGLEAPMVSQTTHRSGSQGKHK